MVDISQLQATATTIGLNLESQAAMTCNAIERHNHLVEEMLQRLRSGISSQNQLHQLTSRFEESLRLMSPGQNEEEIFHDCSESPEINKAFLALNGSISLGPTTSFEVSASFFPEQYMDSQGPGKIKVLSMSEHSTVGSKRVDRYDLRFAVSPRKWQAVCVFISISVESKYYGVTRIAKSPQVNSIMPRLPARLDDGIAKLLDLAQLSADGNILSIKVNDGDRGPEIDESAVSISKLDPIQLSMTTEFFDFVQDLGCPQFTEGEVIHLRTYTNAAAICCLPGGKLCTQGLLKFESPALQAVDKKRSLNACKERVKTLNAVRGLVGVNQFLGVLVNDEKTHIRAILHELPYGNILSRCQEASVLHATIPWTKIEGWAWQIIEAVAGVHSTANVVGTLGFFYNASMTLDHLDNVMLLTENRYNYTHENSGGSLPPEYRHLSIRTIIDRFSTRDDIFQLGLSLWYLAERYSTPDQNPFCKRANCFLAREKCTKPHSNPISLPPLSPDIPQYYQDIVNICRAVGRSDRWPASKLLSKFPTSFKKISESSLGLQPLHNRRKRGVRCDACGLGSFQTRAFHFFHCNICLQGNFDICKSCVQEGHHCMNFEHFLEEGTLKEGDISFSRRLYSRLTSAGEMKETVFQF